jgi:hypothetical protein
VGLNLMVIALIAGEGHGDPTRLAGVDADHSHIPC